MVRDVTLGQYFPAKSVIHRLDPRVKVILTFLFIVFVFVAQNFAALLLMIALEVCVMASSGVPVKQYFKSLKAVLFIVIFTGILNLFYGSGEPLVTLFGFMQITWNGIQNAIFIAIRIMSLILFSAVLTFTTTPTELTDALERIMKPLKVLHVRVHEIAMMMTIALRFIPLLIDEVDKIMSAQKARGAQLDSGGVLKRGQALVPVFIPLFVNAFTRAYDLAFAMECRCYRGGEGRTRLRVMKFCKRDYAAIAITVVCLAGIGVSNAFLTALI